MSKPTTNKQMKLSFLFTNQTEEPLRVVCDGEELDIPKNASTRLEGRQVRIQLIGRALPGPPDCALAEWCNYTFDEKDIAFATKYESYDHGYPIESGGPRRALTLDEGAAASRFFTYHCRTGKDGLSITTEIEDFRK